MLRRSSKAATTLDQSKQELAQRESELRKKMEELEQLIADAPRVAEEMTRQQREELLTRASAGRSRLDVAISLQDKRYSEEVGGARRPRALRKERREGRIIFIVLLITLLGAILWLVTHFQKFF
jgi:phage repressor protein C with HTH and peptisase S24 domain